MATEAEQLILRGLNILMRVNFSPSEPAAQARHFAALQGDIGPWFNDYVTEISKPVSYAVVTPIDPSAGPTTLGSTKLER